MVMIEAPNYCKADVYIMDSLRYDAVVNRSTGGVEYRRRWDPLEEFLSYNICIPEKRIYFPRLFDDLLEYYHTHKSEDVMARLLLLKT